ncbi:SPAC1F5.02 [Ecytonucleospora hepatopenaei]|uniref:SPAC1F5.02 n=1 Tax=Ecytonucleospora hepatopenaei TaxID=646526 RepID=A0A1W0E822_9MICR|nr:hypothetical protein EHP00_2548 [Ecytonucleospora hepatopenaei]OQS55603.1 SPAC1F5.02 [Ecytonucleospora hepatopenaei]
MLITNIVQVFARELLMEASTFPTDLPTKYNTKENKALKENEAVLNFDGVKVSYKSVEEATHAYEVLKNIKNYLENLPEIVTEIQTKERSFEKDLLTGTYNFIVFFTDKATDIQKIQNFEVLPNFKIMISTSKADAKKVGANFPGIYCYNAEEKNSYTMEFPPSLVNLSNSILLKSFEKISAENIRYFQSWEKKMIYFINNRDATYEEDAKRFNPITKKFTTKTKVIWFKPEDVPLLNDLLKLDPNDYPVMCMLDEKAKFLVKKVTEGNMANSIDSLLAGKAEKIVFSSEIPEDNKDRLIKVMNTETISKERADLSVDKLFVFTSPNCGHCKNLKPVLESLSKILKNKSVKIDFFEYNTLENEPVSDLDISGVPAMYFKKQGEKEMIVVDGKRSIPELLMYLAEQGVSSKINLDDFKEHIPKEEKVEEEKEKATETPEEKTEEEAKELL